MITPRTYGPPTVWLLTAGTYSDYHVEGAFRDEETAIAIRDQLAAGYTGHQDWRVQEFAYLDGVTVVPQWTSLALRLAVKWDGTVGQDDGVTMPEPVTRLRLSIDDEPVPMPPACEVRRAPYETSYTLGVTLRVDGTDLERVRKVFSEQRAQILGDPATATVKAWAEQERTWQVPSWIWERDENRPIVGALRQAGVT